jgi:hypothetical protein
LKINHHLRIGHMLKIFLFSVVMFAHVSLFADISQGETLERQRWEAIKKQNWKDLDNLTAPYFQLSTFDGARTKEQFMNVAKSLNISDYTLSDFVITEGPGVVVVTYEINLTETIRGERLTSNASRLSVWLNDNGKWQIIAHAVLIPVPAAPPSKK